MCICAHGPPTKKSHFRRAVTARIESIGNSLILQGAAKQRRLSVLRPATKTLCPMILIFILSYSSSFFVLIFGVDSGGKARAKPSKRR